MARRDPHSYNDDTQPAVHDLSWIARVDFASRTLSAVATLQFEQPVSGMLDLDTRELDVKAVTDLEGNAIGFEMAAAEPVLGARLRLLLPAGTRAVCIFYRTSPAASALQWLSPGQTAGGQH